MKHDFNDGMNGPVNAHKHPNGGGWVADSAFVAETAYVGPEAKVYHDAWVGENARIDGRARIYGEAEVGGNAIVTDDARAYDDVRIYDADYVGGKEIRNIPLTKWDPIATLDKYWDPTKPRYKTLNIH